MTDNIKKSSTWQKATLISRISVALILVLSLVSCITTKEKVVLKSGDNSNQIEVLSVTYVAPQTVEVVEPEAHETKKEEIEVKEITEEPSPVVVKKELVKEPKKVQKPQEIPKPKPKKEERKPQQKTAVDKKSDTKSDAKTNEQAARELKAQGEAQAKQAEKAVYDNAFASLINEVAKHKDYPSRARNRGIEGTCELAFSVKDNGVVSAYTLTKQSGAVLLDAACRRLGDKIVGFNTKSSGRNLRVLIPVSYKLQ